MGQMVKIRFVLPTADSGSPGLGDSTPDAQSSVGPDNPDTDPLLPAGETVWAELVGEDLYRVRNIPFAAVGYADGDIVRCIKRRGWDEVTGMVQDSGNGTLLLLFANAESAVNQQVLADLEDVGCTYERGSSVLVGVTVPAELEVPFSQLSNYLNGLPDKILTAWEVCKRPTPPSPA